MLVFGEARYEGAFLNGKPNGKGALTNASGTFDGTWQMAVLTTAGGAQLLAFRYNPALKIWCCVVLEETEMRTLLSFAFIAGVSAAAIDAAPAAAEPRCRMEKQCRWVNFKKVCTYVKVCR